MTHDPFDPFNELIAETDPVVLAEGYRWVQQQFYGATMYTDFFLRFDSPADADAALFDEQTNVEGDVVETTKVPKYAAIDVIGQMYKATGQTIQTDDGENYYTSDVMESIPGWHVNVRHTDEAPELEAFRVFPNNPQRGWA